MTANRQSARLGVLAVLCLVTSAALRRKPGWRS